MIQNRILNVIKNEGILAFFYLIRNKINQNISEQKKYELWMKKNDKSFSHQEKYFYNPLISIILTGDSRESAESILNQSYANKELLCVGQSTHKSDHRIFPAIFDALQRCQGEYIGFVNHGDILHQECLNAVVYRLNEKKEEVILYSDEDRMDSRNRRYEPFFKPDYSPDTLRSFFYIGGFFCVHREWVLNHGFKGDWSGDWWDYEFLLWLSQKIQPAQIGHIRQVLYHRKNSPDRNLEELASMKQRWLEQSRIRAYTEPENDCRTVRIVYEVPGRPLVSIIIPSKDNPKLLETCLNSIRAGTQYENYEVIVVDNGGIEENKLKYEKILSGLDKTYQYHYEVMEFNFSRMCNIGRKLAKGELLLFLNDDIEVMETTRKDWLDRMIGHAMQAHIGATGVKLYYPDSTLIQHTGVINYKYGAAHTLSKQDDRTVWDNGRNRLDYNYLCVTGACMMMRSSVFDELGGFDESLAVTFNDIELCYRMNLQGYYCVVRNDVIFYHHESITRGEDAANEKKQIRNLQEREKLFTLHPEFVYTDPFYSPYLTQIRLDNSIDFKNTCKPAKPIRLRQRLEKCREKVTWKIEAIHAEDTLRIEGYAFMEMERYNNMNRIYIVMEDEHQNQLLFRADKWYYPTLAKQLDIKKKVHLSAFTVYADKSHLKGTYTLGVYLKNPLSGRTAWIMGNRKLILDQGII